MITGTHAKVSPQWIGHYTMDQCRLSYVGELACLETIDRVSVGCDRCRDRFKGTRCEIGRCIHSVLAGMHVPMRRAFGCLIY